MRLKNIEKEFEKMKNSEKRKAFLMIENSKFQNS